MALPFRGIQRQSNIIYNMCRTTAEIQQVDVARDGTNNRKETIFKPPNHNILHVTLKPNSPVYILNDSRPIWHW